MEPFPNQNDTTYFKKWSNLPLNKDHGIKLLSSLDDSGCGCGLRPSLGLVRRTSDGIGLPVGHRRGAKQAPPLLSSWSVGVAASLPSPDGNAREAGSRSYCIPLSKIRKNTRRESRPVLGLGSRSWSLDGLGGGEVPGTDRPRIVSFCPNHSLLMI